MKFILALIFILYPCLCWAVPLAVTWKSDLNFGTVYAGSGPVMVLAGSSENSENASFSITGDAARSFNIILPSSVTLSHNGEEIHNITMSNFTSNMSTMGVLPESGADEIYVGATVNAIPVNLPAGSYRGSFTIEVIY